MYDKLNQMTLSAGRFRRRICSLRLPMKRSCLLGSVLLIAYSVIEVYFVTYHGSKIREVSGVVVWQDQEACPAEC